MATTDLPPGGGARATTPQANAQATATAGLSGDDVAHLAMLARIELSEAERQLLAGQLSVILDAVASLQGVVTPDVPPTSHPVPLSNVWRDDTPRPSLSVADAVAAAPAVESDRFRVPRILEED